MSKQTSELDDYLRTVARVYDAARHEPELWWVHTYYAHLKCELLSQFDLLSAFVSVSFTDVDPYGGSAEMFESVRRGSLAVYTGANMPSDHPFTELAPARIGQNYNTVFRAVHDGLAHYPERNSFGKLGEFKAFRAHARLLSWEAIQALFTETVAQNSWYHFGPNPKSFAPQRATILPETLIRQALNLEL